MENREDAQITFSQEITNQLNNRKANALMPPHPDRNAVERSVERLRKELNDDVPLMTRVLQVAAQHLKFLRPLLPNYSDDLQRICRHIKTWREAEKEARLAEVNHNILEKLIHALKSHRTEVLKPQRRIHQELEEVAQRESETAAKRLQRGEHLGGKLTQFAPAPFLEQCFEYWTADVEVDEIVDELRSEGLVIDGRKLPLEDIIRSFNRKTSTDNVKTIWAGITQLVNQKMRQSDPLERGFDSPFIDDNYGASDIDEVAYETKRGATPAIGYMDAYDPHQFGQLISGNDTTDWKRTINESNVTQLKATRTDAVTMVQFVSNLPIPMLKGLEELYLAYIKAKKGFSMPGEAESFEIPFKPDIYINDVEWPGFLAAAIGLEVVVETSSTDGGLLYIFTGRTGFEATSVAEAIQYVKKRFDVRVELCYRCAIAVMEQYHGVIPDIGLPAAVVRIAKRLKGLSVSDTEPATATNPNVSRISNTGRIPPSP